MSVVQFVYPSKTLKLHTLHTYQKLNMHTHTHQQKHLYKHQPTELYQRDKSLKENYLEENTLKYIIKTQHCCDRSHTKIIVISVTNYIDMKGMIIITTISQTICSTKLENTAIFAYLLHSVLTFPFSAHSELSVK